MTELSQIPNPRLPRAGTSGVTGASGEPHLDVSAIMELAGETAFAWDFARDTITWDQHGANLLKVSQVSQIATGAAFQLKIAPESVGLRRKAMICPKGHDGGRSGIPYRLQYRFHPRGRSDVAALYLEEQGCWWAGGDGRPMFAQGVIREISEKYAQDERMRYRGEHDELTGQLNRATLIEVLSATIVGTETTRKPCAFLLASVNGLDVVNETFGFAAGDEMLAQVAKLIKRHMRAGDQIGRTASNKFGIVLNDCGPGIMRIVADRLMAAVRSAPVPTSAVKLAATISIGGIGFSDASMSAEQGMACALQALERARRRRLDSFVAYEPGPEEETVRRRNTALANTLINALDEQRMVLELQPLVSAKTGKPEHYECLLRMITPDGARVSAGEFMPIAEQLGLSRLIDLRTLELAVGLLNRYPELHIALNVSGLTSSDNDWLVSLHRLTGGAKQITGRLTIEITETAALHDLDQTMVFVDTIKDLGCKAAIDDFGVGHTNFRNLKLLNADLVKIDGSFVKNVCQDKGDQVFIKSMVELAKVFNMQTVAEWVGDAATAKFLTDAGIDYLQGYYFSEPAPPEKFLGAPLRG
ncbi:MAG: GGDEF and EAL domain-containing protein [Hyphomicrobiaceae bacterium]